MAPTVTDPRFTEVQSHRPYLVRYALAQLRDPELAEEAVQETLLAALEGLGRFKGESTLRTWLTSILRFKVIDLQRRVVAERRNVVRPDAADEEDWTDELFDETGHWREAPQSWGNPEAAFEQRRFWETFQRCLDRLSPAAARIFFKREVMGEDTQAICQSENITESNCWVILHRARQGLRGCLEKDWFARADGHGG